MNRLGRRFSPRRKKNDVIFRKERSDHRKYVCCTFAGYYTPGAQLYTQDNLDIYRTMKGSIFAHCISLRQQSFGRAAMPCLMPCGQWGADALRNFPSAFGARCGFTTKTLIRPRTILPATQAGTVSPQTDSSSLLDYE